MALSRTGNESLPVETEKMDPINKRIASAVSNPASALLHSGQFPGFIESP